MFAEIGSRITRIVLVPLLKYLRPGDESDMEAFTDNRDPANGQSYDRVTFCNTFFKLPSLSDTVRQGKALPETGQRNLANYDNRARVWFHEVTRKSQSILTYNFRGAKC
jgi:hypothetical protein